MVKNQSRSSNERVSFVIRPKCIFRVGFDIQSTEFQTEPPSNLMLFRMILDQTHTSLDLVLVLG